MSDATMAELARELAKMLINYARERRPDLQKEIAQLHHMICQEYREEVAAGDEKENGG